MNVKIRKIVKVHKIRKIVAAQRYLKEIAKLVRGLTLEQLKDLIAYAKFLRDTGAGH